MENTNKKVISFFLDEGTMGKLDAICTSQRRNRSLQIAFLIDEAYKILFPETAETLTEGQPAKAE